MKYKAFLLCLLTYLPSYQHGSYKEKTTLEDPSDCNKWCATQCFRIRNITGLLTPVLAWISYKQPNPVAMGISGCATATCAGCAYCSHRSGKNCLKPREVTRRHYQSTSNDRSPSQPMTPQNQPSHSTMK